ncbi:trigger factor [Bacteroidales bacterium OttesenSCG-928-I14]|nr:trigger factor [Bacteroidales bacterium OttesenSCG-928-I14]
MKITLNTIDPVNATLTVNVIQDDYSKQVKSELSKIRKSANIPGFRVGMAPQGMIQKMYGKAVLVDEVNKLVSNELYKYIQDNKLRVLGEPLPSLGEQAPLDFDNQTDYEFTFDLGLSPEMGIKLTKRDKVPYYSILVTDDMVEKQINSYKANFGSYDQVSDIEPKDMVKGTLVELNPDGSVKDGGINNPDSVLMPSYIKNEDEKNKFMTAKLGDTVTFNPFNAYEGNETELSSFLKVTKEEVAGLTGDFSFNITEITRYKEAEMDQNLFDKAFGEGVVSSEEEFKNKIKENISTQLAPEGDYRFLLDIKELILKKAEAVVFPDEFLKRWLVASNEDKTEEALMEDYPKIINDLKFHLFREEIIKEKEIKVDQEDIKAMARKVTLAQFAQYGMPNVPEDLLENYSAEMLKKEETVRNLVDRILEDKVTVILKEKVALQPKEITSEEFEKLFETK